MVPYTKEVFLAVVAHYNEVIWPAQVIAGALGGLVLLLVLKPRRGSGLIVAAVLATSWLWVGCVYNGLYYATINWAAWLFGGFCLAQGILLAWSGVFGGRLAFRFCGGLHGWTGLGLIVYGMALHPLVERLTTIESWSQAQVFGVTPAPTTVFTLGVLLLAAHRVQAHFLVIPLLWAVVGGARAWLINLPADLVLPLAGLLAIGFAVPRNRRLTREWDDRG